MLHDSRLKTLVGLIGIFAYSNLLSFQNKQNTSTADPNRNQITCTDTGCSGKYIEPEFVNGDDVAHQFSNTMSKAVGDKLKELYNKGTFVVVDFSAILMSTERMGSGKVIYTLEIPFKNVYDKCRLSHLLTMLAAGTTHLIWIVERQS